MILNLLFPNRCANCDYIILPTDVICETCFTRLNFTNYEYSENHHFKQRCSTLFPIENAFALFRFEQKSVAREIIHHLKYKGREKIAYQLAAWISNRIDFQGREPDLIITVPLHHKKQKQRGYNQLHLVADLLSKQWQIPHDKDAIIRKDHQKAQALKRKNERNTSNNRFELQTDIKNKHILLLDDVFTTGNTLAKIAWELLPERNNKISILVLALDA